MEPLPPPAKVSSEPPGPPGDPSRHLPLTEIHARFATLPSPSKDAGRLCLIVRRRADGVHESLERVPLSPDGVSGDRWGRRLPLNPDAQLTVIRRDVLELLANGQPITISGDNLIVDLDLSAANLPVGARLRIGEAIVEMTPKPHNGCLKFKARFGDDALQFVQAKATRDQNLRGIYWKVIEPGEVRVGAVIQVLSRPNDGCVSQERG
jgi:MOSC domain-containing protein YiiM